MSDLLPMFPLQIVVFPNEDLNLHIFEPRYQELVRDCEEEELTFGIPAYIEGKLMAIGTEIRLNRIVKKYPGGESDIRTKGMGIFAIKEYFEKVPGKLYSGASIERLELDMEEAPYLNEQILEKTRELFQLLDIEKDLPEAASDLSVFDIAHHIGLSLDQEYELLSIGNAQERQEFIIDHLTRLIPVVKHMDEIREKARMNGHFRRINPPK
ncbi:LON peptidase substrate-binding domain-containing protein [Flavilitoribacter nigricans]|uniref:Peptidase n=1 Tax=Flavilitoribacter nigricans (strain ATCC 23147 / DSM 23189 / NBRC 102662 / NCIMB 1420 / SS-2) TaxID=1122177 RepID=A0A2D0NDG4_FLAN2|nr:LON peptidase substrate-binding domain-containing protein [Flavilitoribacter nigricans]PHN06219.1 peptidase [Flavilitoribacter nigricans DSM 23189 = NBRC 102662]